MSIARVYQMIAAEGKDQMLLEALTALERLVRPLDGCLGVELLRDVAQTNRFLFIEKWRSVEAHKAAGPLLPKSSFGPVMQAIAGPPESSYQEYLIGG
jgi:heme oxygenase (mycobilin-producing)